jgi:two-component system, OmpR family, sensor kinase
MFTNSIRWRLNLWLGFLLVCLLSGFGATIYQLQRMNALRQLDDELERRVAALSVELRNGPPPEGRIGRPEPDDGRRLPPAQRDRERFMNSRPPGEPFPGPRDRFGPPPGAREFRPGPREIRLSSRVTSLFDEVRTNGYYFVLWANDRSVLKTSTNAPVLMPFPMRFGKDTAVHKRMRADWREAFQFTERGDCVLAGHSMTDDFKELNQFTYTLLAAGGVLLAFGLGVGWWLTTHAIRPVEEISAAASRISAGNLAERIIVRDTDNELGRLASVLNSTFARLESSFGQQKQFVADASHELRTPLSVIISESQTTLARERTAAEYREAMETCLDAAQQMRRLAQSLLELARFDAGQEPMQRERFDLAEQTRSSVELIRPLATERGIAIDCSIQPAEISGDADRVHQVITNLLTNAISYNKPNGNIRVATRRENGSVVLSVADTGQGIAAEDLPHVFERFYRADKSRARVNGHSGLGLAICKAIVDAHGGSIEVISTPGEGTTFHVKLPAA